MGEKEKDAGNEKSVTKEENEAKEDDKKDDAKEEVEKVWVVGDIVEAHFEDWWYEAKILDITDSKYKVKFEIDDSEVTVEKDKIRKKEAEDEPVKVKEDKNVVDEKKDVVDEKVAEKSDEKEKDKAQEKSETKE